MIRRLLCALALAVTLVVAGAATSSADGRNVACVHRKVDPLPIGLCLGLP